MTIPRRLIMDNLATTLAGINGTGTYTHTVANVYRHLRTWSETLNGNRTTICVVPGIERYTYEACRDQVQVDLEVDILAHITTSTETLRINSINDLLDDIWQAIMLDPRRGTTGGIPNAVDTQFVESWTDEADVLGQESLGAKLRIIYYRTTGDS